jgi:hypothetical protein
LASHRSAAASVLAVVLVGHAGAQSVDVFRSKTFVQQISSDPFAGAAGSEADTQVEPSIALDPNDPSTVVAVFQQGRFDTNGASVDPGFATSRDGGRTWTAGNLPGLTVAVGGAFERASDPVVAIGPDGSVYAQTLALNVSDCRNAVSVQRSDDHGLTFGAPVLVQDDSACTLFNDKNWIAVDTFPGSPHFGRVYGAWDRIDSAAGTAPTLLRFSDDRGATWSGLVTVSDPSVLTVGALPLVQPNGDVTVIYDLYGPPTGQVSQTSHDGGRHFDPPVTIQTDQSFGVSGMRTGAGLPAAAVDPVSGRLYAVWADGRFRSDGLDDIVLSVSSDGGTSWGPLGLVNSFRPGDALNHFTPAVTGQGGAVLVSYRTRRGDSSRVDVRYVASSDGGTTFGREHRLGRSTNLDFAATARGLPFLGDYMGLTASANAAHAVWCVAFRARLAGTHHQTTWSATLLR